MSFLVLNAGSSSIRFSVHSTTHPGERLLSGTIERIGMAGTELVFSDQVRELKHVVSVTTANRGEAVSFLLDWLEEKGVFKSVGAVGHRLVHGMAHTEPAMVSPELITELKTLTPYDPEHLPAEIQLIEAIEARHAGLPQVVCFDTAFHSAMPRVATQLAIPRRYEALGLRRYGFHGLSYSFVMEELMRLDGAAATGKVILAHLGGGASLAAVEQGKCLDTSMGFSPASGVMMGTRTGDLDPGVSYFLGCHEGMSPEALQHLVNHESGLLGVSETSADFRDLLERENDDVRAADALALFCYQVKKCIGSYAAVLGGLDTLVFTGGIGENSAIARERICKGLGFLGVQLRPESNARNDSVISRGVVEVRVIRTHEEVMIARAVMGVMEARDNARLAIL